MKEKGSAFITLLVIVIIGMAIGIVIYILSSNRALKEKTVQPDPVAVTETKNQATQIPQTNPEPSSVKSNFSHEGAFFAGEDGWVFLWEEPGQLALTVKVKFTGQSVCRLGGGEKDCALISTGPESYDRVILEGERVGDEVTAIKVEEVKMPQ
ncbi:hypothetical protein KKE78_01210 [Patescibacteria group bacterium]|nr:hypothetical protein [Patescibacteria group bacterium]